MSRFDDIERTMRKECGLPKVYGPASFTVHDRIDDLSEYAVYRYPRYRKQGLVPIAALEACEAYDRNMTEQRARRKEHPCV